MLPVEVVEEPVAIIDRTWQAGFPQLGRSGSGIHPTRLTHMEPLVRYSRSSIPTRVWLGLATVLVSGALIESLRDRRANAGPALIAPESEIITLFDGVGLNGWEGHEKYWSVADGAIVGKNSDEVPVSTYLFTKRKFTDFRLKARVKLVTSEMHSGIAFWGKAAPEKGDPFTYMGHLVMFPSGWGMYDLHRRGGLPVDGKPAKAAAEGKQHDWNNLEILATGHRVRVAVNGVAVVDFTDPKPELVAEGPIALQLHSNKVPQEVRFEDIVVETFPRLDKLTTVKNP